jgi:hypothetical protein
MNFLDTQIPRCRFNKLCIVRERAFKETVPLPIADAVAGLGDRGPVAWKGDFDFS